MIVGGRVQAALTLAIVAALAAIGLATLVRLSSRVALVIGLLAFLATLITVVIAARAWDPTERRPSTPTDRRMLTARVHDRSRS